MLHDYLTVLWVEEEWAEGNECLSDVAIPLLKFSTDLDNDSVSSLY